MTGSRFTGKEQNELGVGQVSKEYPKYSIFSKKNGSYKTKFEAPTLYTPLKNFVVHPKKLLGLTFLRLLEYLSFNVSKNTSNFEFK